MTRGTVHHYDPDHGTGVLCCIAGTHVPFSSTDPTLSVGDEVTFSLTGGIAGLYALHVEPTRNRPPVTSQRQMATSSSPFRSMAGTLAPAAG